MMKVVPYLILIGAELFAGSLAVVLDYYGKKRNYDKIVKSKLNCIFIQSDYERKHWIPNKNRPISKMSLRFQIINYLYVIGYVIISIVYDITLSDMLLKVLFILAFSYGAICIILLCVFATLTT